MGNAADILILGADNGGSRVAALEFAGYSVACEAAGTDVLAAIQRHNPSVVLVSVAGSKGLDTIRSVKADTEAQRVPVAAIDIGFPMRYSHSSLEVCDLNDLASLTTLILTAIGQIGPDFPLNRGAN